MYKNNEKDILSYTGTFQLPPPIACKLKSTRMHQDFEVISLTCSGC